MPTTAERSTAQTPGGWSVRRSVALIVLLVVLVAFAAAVLLWAQSGFSNPYGQPNVTTENARAQASGCGGSNFYTLTFAFTLMNSGDRAANVGLGMRWNGTAVSDTDFYAPAHSSVPKTSVVYLSGPCPVAPLFAEVRILRVTPASVDGSSYGILYYALPAPVLGILYGVLHAEAKRRGGSIWKDVRNGGLVALLVLSAGASFDYAVLNGLQVVMSAAPDWYFAALETVLLGALGVVFFVGGRNEYFFGALRGPRAEPLPPNLDDRQW